MASEAGDENYVSPLDEASQQKCRNELNERSPADTLIAVQTLRQWVKEQDWLKTPTGYAFLLRFLRFRKFSQLEARKALEKFWTVRTGRPEWFTGGDPADPVLNKVLKMGLICSPRRRDKHGRRVIFSRLAGMDMEYLKQIGMSKVYQVVTLVYDWLVWDEHVQIEGVVTVVDYDGLTMQLVTTFSNREFKKEYMEYFQKALPIRLKSMNAFHEPPFFDAVWAISSAFMSQKLKDRFHLHGKSLVKIFEEVGYECMPDEYLPDDYEGPRLGTCADIIDEMIEDLNKPEFIKYIRDLSSGKYGVDKSRVPAQTEVVGSFRKISAD
ncbi:alpha-tocopherol transfer protein-like [Mya arenaria]|uniref:alpha-tocopherol transfer protein-like n=1 Tax=Mya arenaria TaxID=6604 RepID=UPI0022E18081|nr:alpha-tocopherol transfer protein-like [Mya arenaria]